MNNGIKRDTTTERHDEIFAYYNDIIAGYGSLAQGLSKEYLYEEVANKFHYSSGMVKKIIRNRLKNDGHGKK